MKNIVYKVDENKRTVVAYLQYGKTAWLGLLDDFDDYLMNLGVGVETNFLLDRQATKYALADLKLYAQAKCHPEDVFDAEIGKKIARQRLLDKIDKVKFKYLSVIQEAVGRFNNKLIDLHDDYILKVGKK